jgi:hypothetical protein
LSLAPDTLIFPWSIINPDGSVMAFTQNLTPSQLSRAWKRLVDHHILPAGPVGLTKVQLANAAEALQTYLWDNRAAINTALPVAARNGLTTDQKLALLAVVSLVNLEG